LITVAVGNLSLIIKRTTIMICPVLYVYICRYIHFKDEAIDKKIDHNKNRVRLHSEILFKCASHSIFIRRLLDVKQK